MAKRSQVYLIPAPIGDHFADFSLAGAKILEQLEHLFVEADDQFLARMRKRGLIKARHSVYFLSDPGASVEKASELVRASASFGILASSGIPCFVDPGHEVIDRLLRHHLAAIELVPLGMSSALDAALALAGIDIQKFLFLGHAPENYTADPALFAHRLPVIYFVRGPGLAELFTTLAGLDLPLRRILLLKDIRKKSRQAVFVLDQPALPAGADASPAADYVLVVIPDRQAG